MAGLAANNPARIERKETIAQLRLLGKSMQEIAKELDITKGTVWKDLQDEHVKQILEAGTKALIRQVPQAVHNYETFLKSEDENIKYKASKDLLEGTSIFPGKVQNQYITNIYQQHNTTVVSPVVLKAMAGFLDNTVEEAEIAE